MEYRKIGRPGRRGVAVLLLCAACGTAQEVVMNETATNAEALSKGGGFFDVVAKGGFCGVLLWLMLLALSVAAVHLIVDSFMRIHARRIIPETLVENVRAALGEGDTEKALVHCGEETGALADILSAGFSNIGDGFETVQEAVGTAADLESEKLLQRVNYLNVVGSLAPMLGLLGTVQGMILAFATLGTEAGAAKNAMLATNISQALYTTAAGLMIAVPALGFFSFFRNRATKIILSMEALTLDLMKQFRNR